jgi:hypothetical protein
MEENKLCSFTQFTDAYFWGEFNVRLLLPHFSHKHTNMDINN